MTTHADDPLFADGAPALVGREREQAALHDRLAATLAGRGSLVLIGGEAGIGKTALVETLIRDAERQDALVLTGHCYDLTETPPYGPWVELFGRYQSPDGSPPLPAAFAEHGMVGEVTSQATLFHQVRDFLGAVATKRPLVLFLDDLHWADPASLDLLRFLARDLATHPMLLIATYRADELTRRHPLYALLPALVREANATRLDLRRLHRDDLAALVAHRYRPAEDDAARLVAYLFERSEGNPFFFGELLRTLEEEGALRTADAGWNLEDLTRVRVPALLRQVIDGRLARLAEETQRLLTIGAVIGQEVPLALWATVAETAEPSLTATVERAVDAHLLDETPDGTRARFVHALIREALYEGILPSRRRVQHRQVAEALSALPDPDPDAVAYHFQQAGDQRAGEWLIRAGERAYRANAWLTAADRYKMAAALLATRDDELASAGWLLTRAAWLRRWADLDTGIATLTEAERYARQMGDRMLMACVLYYRGILRCRVQAYQSGLAELTKGITMLDALCRIGGVRRPLPYAEMDVCDMPDHWATLAMWLAFGGQCEKAIAIGERAVALDASCQDADASAQESIGNAYFAFGLAFGAMGRIAEAHAAYAQARHLYLPKGNHPGIAQTALHELAWVVMPYEADQPAKCHALAAEAEERWKYASSALPLDDPPGLASLPSLVLEGKWAEAHDISVVVRSTQSHRSHRFVATGALGMLARNRGEAEDAWALVREWLPFGPATEPGTIRFHDALELQRLAAILAIDARDLETARAWLAAHDRWLTWSAAVLGQAEGNLGWAVYYRAAGDRMRAYEHVKQALALASEPRQPLVLLASHRLFGELDTESGDYERAEAHFDAALRLADLCTAPYERALTLLARASLCEACKDRTAALALLGEARTIFRRLDATPALDRTNACLARLHATLSPHAPYPDGLTAREIDVLRRIAEGMSNREIASTLFISGRTVNRHIENIYRKIGAHGKADATAYAFRHRLT